MNITIAIPCLKRGGTEMQTLHLVKVLVSEGYQVTTLCYFEQDSEVVSEYETAGSSVLLMKLERSIGSFSLIKQLRQEFVKLRPDVIHVQYMAPGFLPVLAAKLAGIKQVLATVHQPYTKSHGKAAKLTLRLSAYLCTRFISVSQNAEISWFGSGGLFNENIPLKKQPKHFTIYNSVDVNLIKNIKNSTDVDSLIIQLGIQPECTVIGAVSRLRYEKGIDLLIEAFSLTSKHTPNIHLLVVGTGPDKQQLKELIIEKGITKNCTFAGEANWETAMQYMALMDIVVVPSRFEGFGLTAAEAMAMSKPMIASNVYGLKEVVESDKTGLLFELNDISNLSKLINNLVENPKLSIKLGHNGFQSCLEHFDISVFSKKIIHLYSLLKGKL